MYEKTEKTNITLIVSEVPKLCDAIKPLSKGNDSACLVMRAVWCLAV